MDWFEAVILGLLQGLTEFLPVSSSGHLVLAQEWLGLRQDDILFEVFVHFGTLVAVLLVFRADIARLFAAIGRTMADRTAWKAQLQIDTDLRKVVFIAVGSIPAAAAGLFLTEYYEAVFSFPLLVSCMLLVTGLILIVSRWTRENHGEINTRDAILMGIAQALAIIPGISRSGSTIGVGMLLGLERNEAARFSFLLSIPVVLGATLLKSRELFAGTIAPDRIAPLVIGTVVAFISGYFSVRFLLQLIKNGKFSYFAYYCLVVGCLGILSFY